MNGSPMPSMRTPATTDTTASPQYSTYTLSDPSTDTPLRTVLLPFRDAVIDRVTAMDYNVENDINTPLPEEDAFREAAADFHSYLYTRLPELLGDAYLDGDVGVLATTGSAAYLAMDEARLESLLRDWRRVKDDAATAVKLAHTLESSLFADQLDINLNDPAEDDLQLSATVSEPPSEIAGLVVPFQTPAPAFEDIPPATLTWREIAVGTAQLAADIQSNETEALGAYYVYTRLLAQDITPPGAYHRLTGAFDADDTSIDALLDVAIAELTAAPEGALDTDAFARRYRVPDDIARTLQDWWCEAPTDPLVETAGDTLLEDSGTPEFVN